MDKLPKDILIKLALELELPQLLSFCLTSSRFNNLVCNNPTFWRSRLIKENLLKKDITEIEDPRAYYQQRRKEFVAYVSKKAVDFASEGDLQKLIKAVNLGAKPKYIYHSEMGDVTALEAASYFGHSEIVKYLVKHWNKSPVFDRMLTSSLIFALERENNDIAKYLVLNGADVHHDDDWSISVAALNGDKEMVKFLSKY